MVKGQGWMGGVVRVEVAVKVGVRVRLRVLGG